MQTDRFWQKKTVFTVYFYKLHVAQLKISTQYVRIIHNPDSYKSFFL
jgi:hypothetical protein